MLQFSNPFVAYLNRYTTVTSEQEAAFDEFVTQSKPPSGDVLQLKTRTEEFVTNHFERENPASIILTGNAGDRKTYLCRQIIKAFIGQHVTDWSDHGNWSIELGNFTLHVIKDLSEIDENSVSTLC